MQKKKTKLCQRCVKYKRFMFVRKIHMNQTERKQCSEKRFLLLNAHTHTHTPAYTHPTPLTHTHTHTHTHTQRERERVDRKGKI
jgi:hypothetical protein